MPQFRTGRSVRRPEEREFCEKPIIAAGVEYRTEARVDDRYAEKMEYDAPQKVKLIKKMF